jgi:hypothetical protein
MKKIDWSKIKFISKPDEYYVEGKEVKLENAYGDNKQNRHVEDNYGFFVGLTNASYNGYVGELPRTDGDTASFDEFDIYYKDKLVNKITYKQLLCLQRIY